MDLIARALEFITKYTGILTAVSTLTGATKTAADKIEETAGRRTNTILVIIAVALVVDILI